MMRKLFSSLLSMYFVWHQLGEFCLKNQVISLLVIISFTLMTGTFDQVVVL